MLSRTCLLIAALTIVPPRADARALAAPTHNVVIDQTGLPIPGVRIEIQREGRVVATLETGLDGGYDLPVDVLSDDTIVVSLDGFETAHVRPSDAQVSCCSSRAPATTTTVVASALTTAGASMEHLGSTDDRSAGATAADAAAPDSAVAPALAGRCARP